MDKKPKRLDADAFLDDAGFVRSLARALLRDRHRAEDLAQQVMVTALEQAPPETSSIRGWLARVTRNLAFSFGREGLRRARREQAAARAEQVPSTLDHVERLETHRRVVDAVLALREPYQSVIVLRFFDDL